MSREPRRDMVLSATLQLISERGFAGVATREVARRAGVSEGLIFHHFGTKEGLFAAAIRSGETLLGYMEDVAAGPPAPDLGAAVEAITQTAAVRLNSRPVRAFTASLTERNGHTAPMRAKGLDLLDQTRRAVSDWMDRSAPGAIRGGGDAGARTLFEGMLYLAITLPDDDAGWTRAAPGAFADLARRWSDLHLTAKGDTP